MRNLHRIVAADPWPNPLPETLPQALVPRWADVWRREIRLPAAVLRLGSGSLGVGVDQEAEEGDSESQIETDSEHDEEGSEMGDTTDSGEDQ